MEAQSNKENSPYYEIPDYPEKYNQGTVVARMIDGLGFRYYWATEGLRAEDLNLNPIMMQEQLKKRLIIFWVYQM